MFVGTLPAELLPQLRACNLWKRAASGRENVLKQSGKAAVAAITARSTRNWAVLVSSHGRPQVLLLSINA